MEEVNKISEISLHLFSNFSIFTQKQQQQIMIIQVVSEEFDGLGVANSFHLFKLNLVLFISVFSSVGMSCTIWVTKGSMTNSIKVAWHLGIRL